MKNKKNLSAILIGLSAMFVVTHISYVFIFTSYFMFENAHVKGTFLHYKTRQTIQEVKIIANDFIT